MNKLSRAISQEYRTKLKKNKAFRARTRYIAQLSIQNGFMYLIEHITQAPLKSNSSGADRLRLALQGYSLPVVHGQVPARSIVRSGVATSATILLFKGRTARARARSRGYR